MSKRKKDFFWASYTDLMTSLFFVMLVLYMLTFVLLKKQQKEFEEKAKRFEELEEMEKSLGKLEETELFVYQPTYKRYIFKESIQFSKESATISPRYTRNLRKAGQEIYSVVEKSAKDFNVRYLLVIEGMASRDRASDEFNYQLSYRRAKSLYEFWKNQGIEFDEKVCEVLIAGSGTGGVGRDSINEVKNQQFLIQIIPKVEIVQTNE